jgi:hypothetical protein
VLDVRGGRSHCTLCGAPLIGEADDEGFAVIDGCENPSCEHYAGAMGDMPSVIEEYD